MQASPEPGINNATIDHLIANQIKPLALSRQRELVLHGAAVEIASEKAIAILGNSGLGKSTLTANFAIQGFRFLTDDGLQLDRTPDTILACPSHPSIRLWNDSRGEILADDIETAPLIDYTPKFRLLADEKLAHCPQPRPLVAIYLLTDEATVDIRISPISPRQSMIELVKHSFLLDIEERLILEEHFEKLTDIVREVPVFTLDYPRDYTLLNQVCSHILGHSGAADNTTTPHPFIE